MHFGYSACSTVDEKAHPKKFKLIHELQKQKDSGNKYKLTWNPSSLATQVDDQDGKPLSRTTKKVRLQSAKGPRFQTMSINNYGYNMMKKAETPFTPTKVKSIRPQTAKVRNVRDMRNAPCRISATLTQPTCFEGAVITSQGSVNYNRSMNNSRNAWIGKHKSSNVVTGSSVLSKQYNNLVESQEDAAQRMVTQTKKNRVRTAKGSRIPSKYANKDELTTVAASFSAQYGRQKYRNVQSRFSMTANTIDQQRNFQKASFDVETTNRTQQRKQIQESDSIANYDGNEQSLSRNRNIRSSENTQESTAIHLQPIGDLKEQNDDLIRCNE